MRLRGSVKCPPWVVVLHSIGAGSRWSGVDKQKSHKVEADADRIKLPTIGSTQKLQTTVPSALFTLTFRTSTVET
eukprot:3829334-Amphidinium_carterae.1